MTGPNAVGVEVEVEVVVDHIPEGSSGCLTMPMSSLEQSEK